MMMNFAMMLVGMMMLVLMIFYFLHRWIQRRRVIHAVRHFDCPFLMLLPWIQNEVSSYVNQAHSSYGDGVVVLIWDQDRI